MKKSARRFKKNFKFLHTYEAVYDKTLNGHMLICEQTILHYFSSVSLNALCIQKLAGHFYVPSPSIP